MKIILATKQQHFFDVMRIRSKVFILEQNVDADIEIDDIDNYANQYVAYDDDNKACATFRIFKEDHHAYIGRLAVLKNYRKQGIGSYILSNCNDLIKEMDSSIKEIHLHAQVQAVDFYEKNGFKKQGEIFMDANIEHILMVKEI